MEPGPWDQGPRWGYMARWRWSRGDSKSDQQCNRHRTQGQIFVSIPKKLFVQFAKCICLNSEMYLAKSQDGVIWEGVGVEQEGTARVTRSATGAVLKVWPQALPHLHTLSIVSITYTNYTHRHCISISGSIKYSHHSTLHCCVKKCPQGLKLHWQHMN